MAPPAAADALLHALRAEGLTVVEVGDWRHYNRNHKGPFGPVHGVMIHHTVTKGSARTVEICRKGYDGLPGPLCHGVITKDGRVHLIGYGRANHAGSGDADVLRAVIAEKPLPADDETTADGNRHFYGFECENLGDGEDPWPAAQLEAIEKAAAAVCRLHGWNERSVIGHREWQPGKVDPRGFSMTSMRARVADRLTHEPGWDRADQEDDVPKILNESNPTDFDLPSGKWTRLAAAADAVIHAGPVAHTTLVHLLLADDTPADAHIEGRFYLTDTEGGDQSSYLPVDHYGGGGHQFTLTGDVPEGRHLRFEVRATTPGGESVKLLHRVVSGLYWGAAS